MSDLQNLIAAIDRNTAAVTALAGACAGTTEEKAKRGRPAKAAETPTEQPAQNGPAPASAASAAGGTGPSLQTVADAIIDLANTVSRDAAVQVLSKYDAAKVPQIRPADFQAVLADVAILKSGGILPPKAGASAGLM